MALTFFPSNRVKIFPCAYRGQYKTADNQVGLYDPESRLNTEYNFVHSSNDWKESYIISWTKEATPSEGYLLKCVIGGYYFEISGCTKDEFIDNSGTVSNLYIKLTPETLRTSNTKDKERKTYRLAAFEDSSNVLVNLDDDAGYFRGIKLSSTDIKDTIKLSVFAQDGTINSSAFLPNISSGSGHSENEVKSNSIQTESNTASGEKSFAIGDNTIAEGKASFSAGTVTSEAHKIIIGIITNVDKPNKQITVDKQNPITINVNDKIKINNTSYTINNISGQIITFNEYISDDVVAENKIYLLYTPKASGENSVVFGENGLTKGKNSFVAGQDLIAEASNQTVLGKYNLNNNADLFVVGNGTEDNRHNAIEIGSNTKINTDFLINDSVKNTHLTIPNNEGTETENHIIATREWAIGATASDSGTCVKRSGDTMVGNLTLENASWTSPHLSVKTTNKGLDIYSVSNYGGIIDVYGPDNTLGLTIKGSNNDYSASDTAIIANNRALCLNNIKVSSTTDGARLCTNTNNNEINLSTNLTTPIQFTSFNSGKYGYAQMPINDGSTGGTDGWYTVATREWAIGDIKQITQLSQLINGITYHVKFTTGQTITVPDATITNIIYFSSYTNLRTNASLTSGGGISTSFGIVSSSLKMTPKSAPESFSCYNFGAVQAGSTTTLYITADMEFDFVYNKYSGDSVEAILPFITRINSPGELDKYYLKNTGGVVDGNITISTGYKLIGTASNALESNTANHLDPRISSSYADKKEIEKINPTSSGIWTSNYLLAYNLYGIYALTWISEDNVCSVSAIICDTNLTSSTVYSAGAHGGVFCYTNNTTSSGIYAFTIKQNNIYIDYMQESSKSWSSIKTGKLIITRLSNFISSK